MNNSKEEETDSALAARLIRHCERLATASGKEDPADLLTRIHSITDELLARLQMLRAAPR